MTEFFLWAVQIAGAICTGLLFIFVAIKAFGGPVFYNDGVAALAVIAATWLVVNTMVSKTR